MTAENWERVKEILHQAMQLAPQERSAFLDGTCDSDSALREEVESLLLADNGLHPDFLKSPPMAGIKEENADCRQFLNYVAQAPDGLFLICIAQEGHSFWTRADT